MRDCSARKQRNCSKGETGMKIGICCQPFGNNFEAVLKARPDYIEIGNSAAYGWTDDQFALAGENLKKHGIPALCANQMLTGDFRLTGENVTPASERNAFLEKSFSRIATLGVRTVVFGSGKARRVPDGFPLKTAHEQLLEFTRDVGRLAAQHDLTVVIEPLNRFETNVFTSVCETASFVYELNEKNVRLLADSYHMAVESEPYETVKDFTDILVHTHIAEAKIGSREFRRTPDKNDEFGVSAFVRALNDCGYEGGISLECASRSSDWGKDMADAVEAIRSWM